MDLLSENGCTFLTWFVTLPVEVAQSNLSICGVAGEGKYLDSLASQTICIVNM